MCTDKKNNILLKELAILFNKYIGNINKLNSILLTEDISYYELCNIILKYSKNNDDILKLKDLKENIKCCSLFNYNLPILDTFEYTKEEIETYLKFKEFVSKNKNYIEYIYENIHLLVLEDAIKNIEPDIPKTITISHHINSEKPYILIEGNNDKRNIIESENENAIGFIKKNNYINLFKIYSILRQKYTNKKTFIFHILI